MAKVDWIGLACEDGNGAALAHSNFERVARDIESLMAMVEEKVRGIELLHDEAIFATCRSKHQDALRTRRRRAAETDVDIARASQALVELEQAALSPRFSSAEQTARGQRVSVLVEQCRAQIDAYRSMEFDQASRNRDRLARLIEVVCPYTPGDEIRSSIHAGDASQVVVAGIKEGCHRSDVYELLADLAERQCDIANIEGSVARLTRMHNIMSEVAARQHARLDSHDTLAASQGSAEKPARWRPRLQPHTRRRLLLVALVAVLVGAALGTFLGILRARRVI
ncbi:hypothetical protein H4R19_002046 [Coemansia spiralis]|nr:hypothetical protein H4R19_002046 [Coemansia spiralis]